MKYLKLYEDLDTSHAWGLNPRFVIEKLLLTNYRITGEHTINKDGTVDVDGDVYVREGAGLTGVLNVKFGTVSGNFLCHSAGLKSLEGCPEKVGGDFNCRTNSLTSLKGGPKEVGGFFVCCYNRLTSLEGSPEKVGAFFDCSDNQITSLEGSPTVLTRYLDCSRNRLTSLKGCPEYVAGCICSSNKINTLEYTPIKYTLLNVEDNDIWNFDNIKFNETFTPHHIDGNPIRSIYSLFKDPSRISMFQDYDIIRDDRVIILDRLNAFLKDTGEFDKDLSERTLIILKQVGYKFI